MDWLLTYLDSTTDLMLKFNNLTQITTTSSVEVGRVHRDGEMLLEMFFTSCQRPNKAEISVLASVCRVDADFVGMWCKLLTS